MKRHIIQYVELLDNISDEDENEETEINKDIENTTLLISEKLSSNFSENRLNRTYQLLFYHKMLGHIKDQIEQL